MTPDKLCLEHRGITLLVNRRADEKTGAGGSDAQKRDENACMYLNRMWFVLSCLAARAEQANKINSTKKMKTAATGVTKKEEAENRAVLHHLMRLSRVWSCSEHLGCAYENDVMKEIHTANALVSQLKKGVAVD